MERRSGAAAHQEWTKVDEALQRLAVGVFILPPWSVVNRVQLPAGKSTVGIVIVSCGAVDMMTDYNRYPTECAGVHARHARHERRKKDET
jgi:hypothetical protein